MATKSRVFICGDTHSNWDMLNKKTQEIFDRNPEKVDLIVAGDFGYWPNIEEASLSKIQLYDKRLRIFFCPGNHENWWALKELEKDHFNEPIRVHTNIFYCPFGTTRNFNGRTFLFCGGADSIDKNSRMLGVDWFPEEIIRESDMEMLPDKRVQVIISHTCPSSVYYALSKYLPNPNLWSNDPSTKYLSIIFRQYQPKRWFFGHWHTYCSFRDFDTEFTCLDRIDSNRTSLVEYF